MKVFGIEESEEVCVNCKHFHQHYIEKPYPHGIGGFMAVNAGHCVEPMVKNRKPNDTCKRFEMRCAERGVCG